MQQINVKEVEEKIKINKEEVLNILSSKPEILERTKEGYKFKCLKCGIIEEQHQFNKNKISKLCDKCKKDGGFCCVCSKRIEFGRVYCNECFLLARETELFNHAQQAKIISGDNNPSKRLDVQQKIINQMKERQKSLSGLKSNFELRVKNVLDEMHLNYEYEKLVFINGKCYKPDFVVVDNIVIVVAGWIWEDKKKLIHLKRYTDEVKDLLKIYNKIIIVTYKNFAKYFANYFKEDLDKIAIVEDNFETKTLMQINKENICNVDYSHFLYFHESLCHKIHGHTSWNIGLGVEGYPVKGMLIDYGDMKKIVQKVFESIDHRLIVNQKHIKESEGNLYTIEYETDSFHKLILPKDEIFIFNDEPTLENIISYFAEIILNEMPENIKGVNLKMSEGINNEANCYTERKVESWNKFKEILNYFLMLKTVSDADKRNYEKVCSHCGKQVKYSEWCVFHFRKRRDFCSLKCYQDFFNDYNKNKEVEDLRGI